MTLDERAEDCRWTWGLFRQKGEEDLSGLPADGESVSCAHG